MNWWAPRFFLPQMRQALSRDICLPWTEDFWPAAGTNNSRNAGSSLCWGNLKGVADRLHKLFSADRNFFLIKIVWGLSRYFWGTHETKYSRLLRRCVLDYLSICSCPTSRATIAATAESRAGDGGHLPESQTPHGAAGGRSYFTHDAGGKNFAAYTHCGCDSAAGRPTVQLVE